MRRCKSLHHSCDPRLRIVLLFVAAVALTALCIAIPWLPYSPWNKPLRRYGIVEVRCRLSITGNLPGGALPQWHCQERRIQACNVVEVSC